MRERLGAALLCLAVLAAAPSCKDKDGEDPPGTDPGQGEAARAGVDPVKKVVSIGILIDESGPAVAIGKPYANGWRLLARRINAGGSGVLPDGWTVKLVERDHGYNPQQSVQQYNAIKNDVLFIGTSFGTPNTLPLRKLLERDDLIAFPASLSSQMAQHEHTPPIGPSYASEARRAMDWAVEHAGGADKVRAGIVYQKDDYGKDGLEGWKAAAALHGVEVVSEQTVEPGQKDATAVITALQSAGANYVLLTTLPSSTGPIVGTAAQLQYSPVWIGNTPAWIDRFFSADVIPPAVFARFHLVTGLSYWGEDVEGMKEFLAAWDQHGADLGSKDSYVLMAYVAALLQAEVLRRTLESGDLTRAGFKKALHSVVGWRPGGFTQPLDMSKVPYETGTQTRLLAPDMAASTWRVVADYAAPRASGPGR